MASSHPHRAGAANQGDPENGDGPAPEKAEANHYLTVTIIVTVGMIIGALLTWIPEEPSPWVWPIWWEVSPSPGTPGNPSRKGSSPSTSSWERRRWEQPGWASRWKG